MNTKRVRYLRDTEYEGGPIVYWMQRDQRVRDNWALLYAQQTALEHNAPLVVIFNLVPDFLEATWRQYYFMLEGLKEVEEELKKHNIPFIMLTGEPKTNIPSFLNDIEAGMLVSDFNPLRMIRKWKRGVYNETNIPYHEVDAHNIVPMWEASDKEEFAAYTIRPKINKLLDEYLEEFDSLKKMPEDKIKIKNTKWNKLKGLLKINFDVEPVEWLTPGETAAHKVLENFINNKFEEYDKERNNPNKDAQSHLSPYFHFGQLAPQRAALAAFPITEPEYEESRKSFLEEMIIRRELSDNFCYYNKNYDSHKGFHNWAQETFNQHKNDPRLYTYTLKQFENAETHEALWNAAQMEMVTRGKMHGYMRMYWAKKILEWTRSPEEAMEIAIYLNDKYELDGRDPNGYAGIAWSIGGVHDRAWSERPIYGKIRYMNENGARRKFDVDSYIKQNLPG